VLQHAPHSIESTRLMCNRTLQNELLKCLIYLHIAIDYNQHFRFSNFLSLSREEWRSGEVREREST
jgi:hypothetical protein